MNSKLLVVGGVAVVSAVTLIAATQQWLSLSLVQGAAAVDSLGLSGQEMNPTLSPIAVAALAASLALSIVGRVFRYVLGVLLIAFGAGIVLIGAGIAAEPMQSAMTALSEITGITGAGQTSLVVSSVLSVWPTVAIAAGGLLAVLGVVVLCVAHRWAQGGRKYQAGAVAADASPVSSQKNVKPTSTRPVGDTKPDRISDWEMLSEGADPSESRDSPSDSSNR